MALSLADELAGAFGDIEGGEGEAPSFEDDGFDLDPGDRTSHTGTPAPPEEATLPPHISPLANRVRSTKSSTTSSASVSVGTYLRAPSPHEAFDGPQMDQHVDPLHYDDHDHDDPSDDAHLAIGAQSGSRLFEPHMEKDPLVSLREGLEAIIHFRHAIKALVDGSSLKGKNVAELQVGNWNTETRLQDHLAKLHESERRREEHIRELGVVLRDMAGVAWEEGALGHSVLDEEEEDEGGVDVGWTGGPSRPTGGHMVAGLGSVREEEEEEEKGEEKLHHPGDRDLHLDQSFAGTTAPDLHLSEDFLSPSLSPLDPPSASQPSRYQCAASPAPLLPHTTRLLQSDTSSLLSSLSALAETLQLSASLSTATSRQLRGIRAGIESWREREVLEERCRRAVEAWEESRLKEGLGSGGGVSAALREVNEGWEGAVEEYGRKMGEIRGRMGVVAAWA